MLYEVKVYKPDKDGSLQQTREIKPKEVSERFWKNINGEKFFGRVCVECGVAFEGPKKQTICTPQCKEERGLKRRKRTRAREREKRNLRPRIADRKCKNKNCDVVFSPKREDHVYHVARCASEYYNNTNRGRNYKRQCRACGGDIPIKGNKLYCYDPCLPKDHGRRNRNRVY